MSTELRKPVVVVTGSSGFIGAETCCRLAKNYEIVALDRPGMPHPPAIADCIDCDISSDEMVREAMQIARNRHGSKIASVIHLAAYYNFSGEPSDLYEEITVRGTERLLRELQGFEVEQFIFSSTMLVHAPCEPGEKIDESWPIAAKWDYPQSKVRTEELIAAQHGNIPYVLLRIAGVYSDQCHSIPIANQIQRIYERWLTGHVFPGDISHGQSFVHLNDAVDALERLVDRREQLPPQAPLLLGEPETMSYDGLQRRLGVLIHDAEWETREIPKVVAKTGAWLQDRMPGMEEPFIKPWMIDLADDHYELDIARAQRLLDWTPQHSLYETLPAMVEFLRRDPKRFYELNGLKPPTRWPSDQRGDPGDEIQAGADSAGKSTRETAAAGKDDDGC